MCFDSLSFDALWGWATRITLALACLGKGVRAVLGIVNREAATSDKHHER